jgi:lysine N6-hydroxylase
MENEMVDVVYDLIGIGIGPFNLGLAAMAAAIPELKCLFIDQRPDFTWHGGMMIPGVKLQVPFYADLVTLADPCSPFSYMSFLKQKQRMFRFAIREDYYIERSTYNEYCRWVADQLPSLQFNCKCESVGYDESSKLYAVQTSKGIYQAKHLVIGIGSTPFIPAFIKEANHPLLLHSADYLFRKPELLHQQRITIIGSGQSAAEIFYDLLQCYAGELYWFTRSARFFPMDYSKLTLEMSTPDYIDHFYSLADDVRKTLFNNQDSLYKGINASLIEGIYSALCEKPSAPVHLHTNCELIHIDGNHQLHFFHAELQQAFSLASDAVVMATGYQSAKPDFLKPVSSLLTEKINRHYSIDKRQTIFVQNAEMETHGFNAPDLSLGPYRNAVILNSILGREHFTIERNTCFQSFGLP